MSQEKYLSPVGILQDPNSLEQIPDPRERRERQVRQLRLLWSNRRFLVRCAAWGFAFSLVVAFLIRSNYEATTLLMPPDNQSGSGAGMALLSAVTGRGNANSGALSGLAGDLLGTKNSGALFVGILGSRTLQDRLIQRFDLSRVYGDSKMEDLRTDLAKHTAVAEDRKSGLISIAVTDHDPKRAAAMSTAYAEERNRLVAEVSTSSARRERIFLEDRLHTVKQDLDIAASKFSDFASKNTAIDIPAQGKAMVEAAAKLQGEYMVAESELRGLEAIYTDQNVRVRALRARVSELQTQMEKLGGDVSLSSDTVSKESGALYPSIRKLPILGVTYADLYRNTKIQETVFELLTQQYELAKVQEAKEIPSVKILDAAVVPTKKVFPPRGALILAGTIVAFVCGCFWLFAQRSWEQIDTEDPGRQFVLEVGSTLQSKAVQMSPGVIGLFKRLFQRKPRIVVHDSFDEGSRASERSGNEADIQKFSSAAGKGPN
ncbi:MAG: GNVR domain-containing protein [Candidatus Acidiferrum sp.]